MNIVTLLLSLIGFTYGAISILAGLLGYKKKKIRLLPSFIMVAGGLLILVSLIFNQNILCNNIYILFLGLVLVHISAIRNGMEIYGKLHYKHLVIRLFISATIIILYVAH